MAWTTTADLVAQIARLWAQGRLLTCAPALRTDAEDADEILAFPLQLRLRRPTPREIADRFEAAQAWIRALEEGARIGQDTRYAIIWEEVDFRRVGRNRVPVGVHVAKRQDALALIGKTGEANRFDALAATTLARFPALRAWLQRRPLMALAHADDWPRILDCLAWFRDHPRSGLYTRQIDVEGVDTKFIESRKVPLAELLDIVLAPAAIETSASGVKGFETRYGLRTKSPLVRFRILDARAGLAGLTDIAVPVEQFAQLSLDFRRVFIVENEITGLAFPLVPESIAVFGLGHAVGLLTSAAWLDRCEIHYWSDIDTHGFAMLDRLRGRFGHAHSLLMDRDTLLAHRAMWSSEEAPFPGSLERLKPEEAALHADLRYDRLGRSVRLEQERIGFSWLRRVLQTSFGS